MRKGYLANRTYGKIAFFRLYENEGHKVKKYIYL